MADLLLGYECRAVNVMLAFHCLVLALNQREFSFAGVFAGEIQVNGLS